MKFMSSQPFPALSLVVALLASTSASAQDAAPDFTLSGSAALVSDYRFRGISYSDLDPAIQGSLTLAHKSGFYVSGWGSSIAEFKGATVELDITGGWSGTLGPLNTSAGFIGYIYPGGDGTDFVELFATAGKSLGPVSATLGLNWAPSQTNLSRSSRYAYGTLSAGIPNTPVTLTATLGNERGALVADESLNKTSKWDWLIGASVTFKPVTLGIAFVGDDLTRGRFDFGSGAFRANRVAKEGVVLSLSASF